MSLLSLCVLARTQTVDGKVLSTTATLTVIDDDGATPTLCE